MVNLIRFRDSALDHGCVANIADRDLQPVRAPCGLLEPLQIVVHTSAREVIENMHFGIGGLQQAMGPV